MRYRFDDCVLDTGRRELSRGADVVAVEPQIFDLIACLIENRERVLSKEDLRHAVWQGRLVSESTLNAAINAARTAIGDNGDEQRLIRTFPRRGFRFMAAVQDEQAGIMPMAAASVPAAAGTPSRASKAAPVEPPSRSARTPALAAAIAAAMVAGLLIYFLRPVVPDGSAPPPATQRFDASVIPLVEDETRRFLASYPRRPESKAIAITSGGMAVVDSQPDAETAKQEALQRCNAKTKRQCRIYAVGMEVVWPKDAIPMPAPEDLRFEPLDIALASEDIPTLEVSLKEQIARTHMKAPNSRALALTTRGQWRISGMSSRAEASRIVLERCAEHWQRHCLLLSVDGMLTVQIPRTRRAVRIFLPSVERDITSQDRQRIVDVYRGAEWRALARGKNGWHPVAGAATETAAVDTAIRSCAAMDSECRLYAIGNFGVADE